MTTATKTAPYIVSREFDAPRDLVWKANTEPERMARWFAPKGAKAVVKKMDFRPGGVFHYGQINDQGYTVWGRVVYREIDPQDRLVYVQSFSNEEGGIGTHPMMPTWPKEMLSTLTFADLGNGRTRMTVEWSPINAAAEELEVFDKMRSGMDQGWGGTFDKLAEYLATEQA
jgi:uncharacterized protein YndB with AHSA1/START domain